MQWTEEDRKVLLAFKENIDSDEIRFKELIKQKLLNNRFIIHCLANKELEEADAEPDEYFGEHANIKPFFMVPDVQSKTATYICYEIQFDEVARYNKIIKIGQIIFYVLCHEEDIIDRDTGIARHDLLSALILDQFNWTNIFGMQIHCVSNKPSTTDSHYATRTIVFEGEFPNSIAKTPKVPGSKARVVNSDVVR